MDNTQLKSFWQKPEGKTGKGMLFLIVAALGTLGVLFADKVIPYILEALQNTIELIFMGVGLALLIAILTSHKTWTAYKLFCRYLTSIFITIDPIGVARIHIQEAKDERVKMNDAIISLDGDMEQLSRTIKTNEEKIQNAMKNAESAKNQIATTDDDNQALRFRNLITLNSQEAARTRDSNAKLYPLLQNMKKMDSFLNKVYINTEFQIQNMINDVDNKEIEWKAVQAATKATRAANNVMNGGKGKEEYDLSMQYLEESIGNQVGEYKRFMETSANVMASMDVQSGAMADDGLKMLAQFEAGGDFTTLLNADYKAGVPNSPEKIMIPAKTTTTSFTQTNNSTTKSSYDDLLN